MGGIVRAFPTSAPAAIGIKSSQSCFFAAKSSPGKPSYFMFLAGDKNRMHESN